MRPCCVLVALLLPARAWHVRPHTRLTVAASSSRSCRRQISLSESLSRNEFAAEFDIDTAVLAAGFAFEAYNEPSERDARWERGADGCDVAFMSEAFARECYRGRLEVRLCEVKDLPCEQELAQKLLSGGNNDPYVIFALNEENEEGPKEGAIGLGRAVDRARSSTVWSKSLADAWKDKGKKPGSATWDEDERFYLYVKDPSRAQLALTVFDEEVLVDDIPLGATSIHLQDLLRAEGSDAQRSWSGWVPLTWRPAETQDNTVMLGTVAGAAVAGPAGAAVGAFVGNMIKKPVQGEVRIELRYTPLSADTPPRGVLPVVEASEEELLFDEEEVPKLQLSTSGAKGGTEGLDWSQLAKRVGRRGVDEAAAYELCCFVRHTATSTEAAIWRDPELRKVVLAFRGTSDVLDVVTDVNLLQTPLEAREDGKRNKVEDERMVHSGFKASAAAVNRRIKELLVPACGGRPGEWELLITGHSLGGALATLMATDVASNVDTSRGFKAARDTSWFGQAADLVTSALEKNAPVGLGGLESFGKLSMYTFGAPRVGNSAYAAHFNEVFTGKEAFRIVNDRDIVARMPRHAKSAGMVLDYEHVGRTVLVAEEVAAADATDGFWVEGSSPTAVCPLRDGSPLTNPFSDGNVLGEVTGVAADAVSSSWGKIDGAAKARSRAELQKAVDESLAGLGKATESIFNRAKSLSAAEALSMLGLDKDFVAAEIAMAESLSSGTAIEHHLEPSYYEAMRIALDAALDGTPPAGATGQTTGAQDTESTR